MNTIRFTTTLGSGDSVIPIPPGLTAPMGRVEITIVPQQTEEEIIREQQRMLDELGRYADELGISGLPSDLAENHDHYIHGTPKRGSGQ